MDKTTVNFVIHDIERWPPDQPIDLGRTEINLDIWVVQTYEYLRQRGEPVSRSAAPRPGCINVISRAEFPVKLSRPEHFLVSCDSDYGRGYLGHVRVVGNYNRLRTGDDFQVHHWTLPSLMPRDPARGDRLEIVSYKGHERNLDEGFRDPALYAPLEFRPSYGKHDGKPNPGYRDFREVDMVIAVRNLTLYDADGKPPHKLVNAWRAGVIPLMGPEPAYRYAGTPGWDYFEVSSPGDVRAAIARLRDEPALAAEMKQRGALRATDYEVDRIADRWVEVLWGPIQDRYLAWRRKKPSRVDWARRVAQHRLAQHRHLQRARRGTRLLEAHK